MFILKIRDPVSTTLPLASLHLISHHQHNQNNHTTPHTQYLFSFLLIFKSILVHKKPIGKSGFRFFVCCCYSISSFCLLFSVYCNLVYCFQQILFYKRPFFREKTTEFSLLNILLSISFAHFGVKIPKKIPSTFGVEKVLIKNILPSPHNHTT